MLVDAILLTKYFWDKNDFDEWMDWHLNKCQFSHIYLIDNNSRFDLHEETLKYGNKVSYEYLDGIPVQADVYNRYVNSISNADYVMPIDDDEYVELSGFNSISDAISYYHGKFNPSVLAVRWKDLFPPCLSDERTGKVIDYCTTTNEQWADLFGARDTFKCIVRRDCNPRYMNGSEPLAKFGTHIPCVNGDRTAMLQDGTETHFQFVHKPIADEHIRLIHCRYKGPSEYKEKCKTWVTISDTTHRKRRYRFNELVGI